MAVTTKDLERLHKRATEARNVAKEAYDIALKNRRGNDDSKPAYSALLLANQVMNDIYELKLRLIVES